MELVHLTVERFRNLRITSLELSGAVNLVLGRNGVGKTSLLEAMVVLANARSFRAGSPRSLVRHGETSYRLVGGVRSRGRTHVLEQVVEIGPPIQRHLRLDGAKVDIARYLTFFPLFAISGLDREIVVGSPDGRRALLDRFTFLLETSHLDNLRTYRQALRQRNAALVGEASDAEIAAWELALARAAARLIRARRTACDRLAATFAAVYTRLSTEDAPRVVLEYRGDPWWQLEDDEEKLVEKHLQRYNETRPRDRQTGFTADGPHRHDLSLRTDGRSVRYVLSTGQVKVVAAALRLAPHAEIERERGEKLPVVVDDVDAELDSTALAQLVGLLGHERQLLLSSTNDRAGQAVGHRTRRIWLENGACVEQEAEIDG